MLRDFWRDFSRAVDDIKDLRTTEVLDASTSFSARTSSRTKADGGDPRACPTCGDGQLSLKLGKFGAFVGCSNYPECRFTRTLRSQADGDDRR